MKNATITCPLQNQHLSPLSLTVNFMFDTFPRSEKTMNYHILALLTILQIIVLIKISSTYILNSSYFLKCLLVSLIS